MMTRVTGVAACGERGPRWGLRVALLAALGVGGGTGSACSGDGAASVEGLSVQLLIAAEDDPFHGVSWVRLLVTGDGLDEPYARFEPYSAGGHASLQGIPFSQPGEKRYLAVEGWVDVAGKPGYSLSRGRSGAFEYKAGDAVINLQILFATVNAFVPLTAIDTGSAQRLATPRVGHTVTVTQDEVVVAGGGTIIDAGATWWNGSGFASFTKTVEAVDLGTMTISGRKDMVLPRAWHTGTALSSGQVIFAGGYDSSGTPTAAVELYNPPAITVQQQVLSPMAKARAGHTATVISDTERLLLFVGGDAEGTWELWDPVGGSHGAEPLPDGKRRGYHQATAFTSGANAALQVLITGGENDSEVLATSLVYDAPQDDVIVIAKPMPGGPRTQHAAVWVPQRSFIYVAGGFTERDRSVATAAIDVFGTLDTAFRDDNAGFALGTARGGHDAVLLPDNVVFMAGGLGAAPTVPLGTVEVIHEFVDAQTLTLRIAVASSAPGAVPFLPEDRVGAHAMALSNGMALLVGGATVGGTGFAMVSDLWLYNPP